MAANTGEGELVAEAANIVYGHCGAEMSLCAGGRCTLRELPVEPGDQAFFNLYIEDPNGAGTTALRGDPVQFDYPGLDPATAAAQPDEAGAVVVANLPTANSQYWLDVNQGSDSGGYSYHLLTGAIASRIRDLGSSFPTAFDVQRYDDSTGTVRELRFVPEVLAEQFDASGCRAAAPAMSMVGSLCLVAGVAGFGVWRLRGRRR